MTKDPREQADDKQRATSFPVYEVDIWSGKPYLNRPLRHTETIYIQMLCSICKAERLNNCRLCSAEVKSIEEKKKKTRRGRRSAAKRGRQ